MKFDLTSLIITVIALLAFIIPVTFDQRTKRKTSKALKKLIDYAKKQELNVDKSKIFQHAFALGLDTEMKTLIYLKTDESESMESIYNLAQISKCRLHFTELNETDSDIIKIGYLRLQFNNTKAQPLDLELYKVKQNLAYNEEEKMAKAMVESINSLLS